MPRLTECWCGEHAPIEERDRRQVVESVEEVVYVKQRIKHFDREGSEFWAEVDIPDIIERQVEKTRITYACLRCGKTTEIDDESGSDRIASK